MDLTQLRQLQTALKNTEGVTLARKAPKQLGLYVDFRCESYRVDYIDGCWQSKTRFVEGPGLAELQALVPVILRCQQDKEAEAIIKAEAEKVEEQRVKAEAVAKAEAKKAEAADLQKKCAEAYVKGWNRQDWTQQRFGKWAISELTLSELQILWEKIRLLNRKNPDADLDSASIEESQDSSPGEEVEKDAIGPAPGEETFYCPECKRDAPWSFGATDEFEELCDDCAAKAFEEKEKIPGDPYGRDLPLTDEDRELISQAINPGGTTHE